MIDDEDSKVRRNLVVYSAVVVAVWFLDIAPLKVFLDKIGAECTNAPPAWRLLFVSFAVLGYLVYRFETVPLPKADSTPARPRPTLREVWAKHWSERLSSLISEDLNSWADGRPADMRLISDKQLDALGQKQGKTYSRFIAPRLDDLKHSGLFKRRIQVPVNRHRYTGRSPDEQIGAAETVTVSCVIGAIRYCKLLIRTGLPAFATSDEGLQHNFPRLIAFAALLVMCRQLGCILGFCL